MDPLPLGRLLCVGLRGDRPGDPRLEQDLAECREAGIGAVILFDVDLPTRRRLEGEGIDEEEARRRAVRNVSGPEQLADLIAHLRARLGEDLLVCVDQEGGRVARLAPDRGFDADPSAAEFAALDEAARATAARRQARQLRRLGFDLNFAPCVDLALEEASPIIAGSGRAYGRDPQSVVAAARVVRDAHLEAGVGCCLKHFPGHGSARGDTHQGLVDITGSWQRDEELAPYRELLGPGGVAVMVAHVLHRDLDPDRPASLSPAVIDGLLRGELGFDGVVVTDSIDMRAIADAHGAGEAAVRALLAGADLVVDGFNLDDRERHPAAGLVGALAGALDEGRLPSSRVEQSLRRLEALRARVGRGR